MIRATVRTKDDFLVDKTLEEFDYLMENKGPDTKFVATQGTRFLAEEVSFWAEVGGTINE